LIKTGDLLFEVINVLLHSCLSIRVIVKMSHQESFKKNYSSFVLISSWIVFDRRTFSNIF